jgi:hypothetical protein
MVTESPASDIWVILPENELRALVDTGLREMIMSSGGMEIKFASVFPGRTAIFILPVLKEKDLSLLRYFL